MDVIFRENEGFYFSDTGIEYNIKFPFSYPKQKIIDTDIQVYWTWSNRHSESNVLSIEIDGKSCGYFFTVTALLSLNSESLDDYFFNAAWAVMNYITLNKKDAIIRKCLSENRFSLLLNEVVDDDLSILVLHKPRVDKFLSENPKVIVPFLMEKGIFLYNGNDDIKKNAFPDFDNSSRKLAIRYSKDAGKFNDFNLDLLINHIPYSDSKVLRFFFYYQIIESFMEEILELILEETIEKLKSSNSDTTKNYEILKDHQKNSSEKNRIVKFFSHHAPAVNGLDQLLSACELYLNKVEWNDKEKNTCVAKKLYEVRNQITHNFRRVSNFNDELSNVVDCMAIVVPQLLYRFRK